MKFSLPLPDVIFIVSTVMQCTGSLAEKTSLTGVAVKSVPKANEQKMECT